MCVYVFSFEHSSFQHFWLVLDFSCVFHCFPIVEPSVVRWLNKSTTVRKINNVEFVYTNVNKPPSNIFRFLFYFFETNETLDTPTHSEVNSRRFQNFTNAFCFTSYSGAFDVLEKAKKRLNKKIKWQPAQIHEAIIKNPHKCFGKTDRIILIHS